MTRAKRRESGTKVYHVVARGNNKKNVFEEESDKRAFRRLLKEGGTKFGIEIYAYCIMSNHVHIMLKAELENLSKFMQRTGSIYAENYNSKYNNCGHVFQGRYYSDCVESEEYYWCCLRYIHNNPVKISLVKEPYDYEYSSAKEYAQHHSEIISDKSYQMVKNRFRKWEDFWCFHKLFEQKSFADTVEDEQIHNRERVKVLAEKYMFSKQIEQIETVLFVGKIKSEFLVYCSRETGLSERKIENILKTMSKRV